MGICGAFKWFFTSIYADGGISIHGDKRYAQKQTIR